MTLKSDYPRLIEDSRLRPELRRTRSGPSQEFRWPGGDIHKPDFVLTPPEQHVYAELVNGQWCWVNGCGPCNGKPRGWDTYIECDLHNVCRTCQTPRAAIKAAVWGGSNGWQCAPCREVQHEKNKAEALAAMPADYDEDDYRRETDVRCPYCNLKHEDDSEFRDRAIDRGTEVECSRCDNTFRVEGEITVYWTMRRMPQAVKA